VKKDGGGYPSPNSLRGHMARYGKIMSSDAKKAGGRPFLQPLAVALVCLVLTCFVLVMGLMDLRALQRTLGDYAESRGLEILREVELAAEARFESLVKGGAVDLDVETGSEEAENALSLRESLIVGLVALARELDTDLASGGMVPKDLPAVLDQEGLRAVVLSHGAEVLTFGRGPLPSDLIERAGAVLQGRQEMEVHVFEGAVHGPGLGFVALRRKSGKGAVILVMDGKGFRFRSLRASVSGAMAEAEPDSEVGYLVVRDRRGLVLGSMGAIPAKADEGEWKRGPGKSLEKTHARKRVLDGANLLEIRAPFRVSGRTLGQAVLGLSTDHAENILGKERLRVFMYVAFLALIASLSMWFLYHNQKRHSEGIRDMERRLDQAERLSAMGRLAAGVAHEIRNPLNAISMATQRLREENLDRLKALIRDEIRRLNGIVEEFLDFSRARTLDLHPHDLKDLVREVAMLIGEEAEPRGVRIVTDLEDAPFTVAMMPDKLKQALLNIIKNALESIEGRGEIGISLSWGGDELATVRISDTGSGLSREDIEKIFNPDYTTKDKGLGLGLTLAHEIIQGHGGGIRVESEPGEGTTFEIFLPRDRGIRGIKG
jgi:signal transduction histidine kinase